MSERELLRAMFDAAVETAQPACVISAFLPPPPKGRCVVVGAGKASAAMAQALETAWSGPLEGLVITRYGHAVPCQSIEVIEAAHPVPDTNGEAATKRILQLADSLGEDDLLIALISGGGSALLTMPCDGLTLNDKQLVNQTLLRSGANITQMNTVRKHLSAIKGGRLAAAAYPARCITLSISDVPGDDPTVIASGPTVGDESTLQQAYEILKPMLDGLPDSVRKALEDNDNETPRPEDERLKNSENHVIATPQKSLEAAADVARKAGYTPLILGDAIEGEAREVGVVMAGIAKSIAAHGHPIKPPCALISGGETTVTMRGNGVGGRNVEFLLGLAQALDCAPDIYAIACDTDGVDGAAEVAGAIVTPVTLARGPSISDAVAQNDGHNYFKTLGDQVITGPTLTNVNDFRAILIG